MTNVTAPGLCCVKATRFYFRGAEGPVSEPIGRSREAVAVLREPGDEASAADGAKLREDEENQLSWSGHC